MNSKTIASSIFALNVNQSDQYHVIKINVFNLSFLKTVKK